MANDKDNKTSKDSSSTQDPSRRKFIKNSGMIVGGVAGGSLLGGLLTNQFGSESTTKQNNKEASKNYSEARMFFTKIEDFSVLEQATERIFPEDNNGPGAIELGVPYFIDKQLAGSWGMNATDYRQGPFSGTNMDTAHSGQTRGELFINGLQIMNKLSHKKFDKPFNEAEVDQQNEILKGFESGDIEMAGVDSSSFFTLLRETTIEGVYSDPLYGGNKNMEGWNMIEFSGAIPSYADVIGSDEFVKLDPISLTDYQQKP